MYKLVCGFVITETCYCSSRRCNIFTNCINKYLFFNCRKMLRTLCDFNLFIQKDLKTRCEKCWVEIQAKTHRRCHMVSTATSTQRRREWLQASFVTWLFLRWHMASQLETCVIVRNTPKAPTLWFHCLL